MASLIADGVDGVRALPLGVPLGRSAPYTITQEVVDKFADATGDHEWIHVDPERAATGPFGGTIAHGFFTLSLLPRVLTEVLEVTGFRMALNYGCNKVRFPAPVPVGSAVTGTLVLDEVREVTGGLQLAMTVTIGVEGEPKPGCVATFLSRQLV
ncbi:MaoC family dehydratase [Pseudonocardia sp. NPDC049154]|uniref:MaoC family dehydratase n=1 Tax=Pseudonocardia sp. NPDC049154 TaxID=3155501 RepID=UPI0033CBA1A2